MSTKSNGKILFADVLEKQINYVTKILKAFIGKKRNCKNSIASPSIDSRKYIYLPIFFTPDQIIKFLHNDAVSIFFIISNHPL